MPQPGSIRLAIVDDHPIFRDALKSFFTTVGDVDVIAEGGDAAAAVRIVSENNPDVLLLDYALPGPNAVDILRMIPRDRSRVIVLTATMPPSEMLAAIQLGARGVVFKHATGRALVDAVHRVMEGGYVLGDEVIGDIAETLAKLGPASIVSPFRLTGREFDIVHAIGEGVSNAIIAKDLGISVQTVKHHLTSIFAKTGVSSRLELALFAVDHGLVTAGAHRRPSKPDR